MKKAFDLAVKVASFVELNRKKLRRWYYDRSGVAQGSLESERL
jgi:hypothetical protein